MRQRLLSLKLILPRVSLHTCPFLLYPWHTSTSHCHPFSHTFVIHLVSVLSLSFYSFYSFYSLLFSSLFFLFIFFLSSPFVLHQTLPSLHPFHPSSRHPSLFFLFFLSPLPPPLPLHSTSSPLYSHSSSPSHSLHSSYLPITNNHSHHHHLSSSSSSSLTHSSQPSPLPTSSPSFFFFFFFLFSLTPFFCVLPYPYDTHPFKVLFHSLFTLLPLCVVSSPFIYFRHSSFHTSLLNKPRTPFVNNLIRKNYAQPPAPPSFFPPNTHHHPTTTPHIYTTMTQATSSQRRHWLTRTLVPLALLIASTNAKCIPLKGSTACPGFDNLQVDTSAAATLTKMELGLSIANFDNLAQFDKAIQEATAWYTSPTSCGTNRTTHIRYQNTVACTLITQDSASVACSPPNSALNMCRTTCTDYATSLAQMVAKSCPSDPESNRIAKQLMDDTCTAGRSFSSLSSTDPACVSGIKNEATTCGKFSHSLSSLPFLLYFYLFFVPNATVLFSYQMDCAGVQLITGER